MARLAAVDAAQAARVLCELREATLAGQRADAPRPVDRAVLGRMLRSGVDLALALQVPGRCPPTRCGAGGRSRRCAPRRCCGGAAYQDAAPHIMASPTGVPEWRGRAAEGARPDGPGFELRGLAGRCRRHHQRAPRRGGAARVAGTGVRRRVLWCGRADVLDVYGRADLGSATAGCSGGGCQRPAGDYASATWPGDSVAAGRARAVEMAWPRWRGLRGGGAGAGSGWPGGRAPVGGLNG
ncbi:hypothetical protein LT493_39645 [Streptomyces tricolor]|nr:hypothetical protein [Streptomyces tricolor]